MKTRLLLMLFVLMLATTSCRHQREIQVQKGVWILKKKDPGHRMHNGVYRLGYWLVWLTPRGVEKHEWVTEEEGKEYEEGQTIINRD